VVVRFNQNIKDIFFSIHKVQLFSIQAEYNNFFIYKFHKQYVSKLCEQYGKNTTTTRIYWQYYVDTNGRLPEKLVHRKSTATLPQLKEMRDNFTNLKQIVKWHINTGNRNTATV